VSEARSFIVGDISVTIDGADLRDIRWRGQEAIRRIYPVFQDRNWTNRLFVIGESAIHENNEGLVLSARGTGSFDATPLRWEVSASITDSVIEYRFHATSDGDFVRNRLGMCVLHPMAAAGAAVEIEHTDGSSTTSHLPVDISPNQPFLDMRSITHELPDGSRTTVRLLGEVYEMEDHRNWTDASFKTYCTPISLPFPVEVRAGDVIDQVIEVSFSSSTATYETTAGTEVDAIHITSTGEETRLPRLGLCFPADEEPPSDTQLEELATLSLDHLRVAVDVTDPRAGERIKEAFRQARAVGARLRVASHCDDPEQLVAFAELAPDTIERIDCWYVFSRREKVTPDDWAARARTALTDAFAQVPLGGGTDLYFTELNREPPDPTAFDVLNFSINPQVHAFDDRTLVQNARTQAVVAANAPRVTNVTPVSVAPISLRPRFNPNATDPEADVSNTALPSDVDARQASYFAANWTAMSVKYLSEAGTVASATYFETIGWKGILEREGGSPDPHNFPSTPGERFPVWATFAALAGMDTAHTCQSSDPEQVDALLVSGDSANRALIVNWTRQSQTVRIDGGDPVSIEPLSLSVLEMPAHN